MKKPSNVLKLFSLVLALLFLLNSCAMKKTDWINPSLKDLPTYQAEQIKQMHTTQCAREAEVKAKQMYEMRYCYSTHFIHIPGGQATPATICDPPNEFIANIQYATDYQNFFKECMVRNGFFEVEVENK